jgi:hypothetical protein
MISKALIANRGENGRKADVSLHCRTCVAGDRYFARPAIC